MKKLKNYLTSTFLVLFVFSFINNKAISEEKIEEVIDQILIISKDLKTLEKAVYKKSDISSSSSLSSNRFFLNAFSRAPNKPDLRFIV